MADGGRTALEIGSVLGISSVAVARTIRLHFPELQAKIRMTQRERQGCSNRQLSGARLDEALDLSRRGFGIDWIGRKLGFDGTSIRYRLLRILGREEYQQRHGRERYRGGPKGYRISDNGDRIQSSYEEAVANFLFASCVDYDMHQTVELNGKRFYPDFLLTSSRRYIEVLGLTNLAFYRRRVEVKRAAYAQLGLDCFWLEKSDMVPGSKPVIVVPDLFKSWVLDGEVVLR
jgi:hypothetical protein